MLLPCAPLPLRRWPPIARLLRTSRPPAVIRLVVAVVVDAIKRVLPRRLLAHVREERLEAAAPTIADRNAATAIAVPCRVARVRTALNHRPPRSVERVTRTGRVPMCPALVGSAAAAGGAISAEQAVRTHRHFGAARAHAVPACVTTSVGVRIRAHGQPSDRKAYEVVTVMAAHRAAFPRARLLVPAPPTLPPSRRRAARSRSAVAAPAPRPAR